MGETYLGQVQNGVIVLEEGTPQLPEGTKVRVEPEPQSMRSRPTAPLLELMDRLNQLPSDPEWPADAAAEHDHYLYGSSKRP